MSDLDLLVPRGKRERALEVLQELGFEYPEIGMNRDHCCRLGPEQEFAPGLRHRDSRILVEVHSQLECSEPVLPIPIQEFWTRSVDVDLNGLRVRALSPADSLFHLCLHQSRSHLFEKGLLPLIDVRLLIDSHKEWHWPRIAAQSIRRGCAAWMYLTLTTARDLTGASVPDSFLQMLPRPAELQRLLCLAEDQILSAGNRNFRRPALFAGGHGRNFVEEQDAHAICSHADGVARRNRAKTDPWLPSAASALIQAAARDLPDQDPILLSWVEEWLPEL